MPYIIRGVISITWGLFIRENEIFRGFNRLKKRLREQKYLIVKIAK